MGISLVRKIGLLFFSTWVLATAVAAQWPAGKVIEQRTVRSAILGKDVRYTIYLPPDYGSSERSYPVVYLLHGYTDGAHTWTYWRSGIIDGLQFIGQGLHQQ